MQDKWRLGMVGLLYYVQSNPSGIDLHDFIIVMLFSSYTEPNAELMQDLQVS